MNAFDRMVAVLVDPLADTKTVSVVLQRCKLPKTVYCKGKAV